MANANSAARLFRRARPRLAPAQPDFADFGTAFGLDMSLQPSASDLAVAPQAATRDSNWWRRLAARRSAAR